MRAAAAVYELILGLTLLFAPWSRLWRENWFVWRLDGSFWWLQSGLVRGAVAGFGAAFVLTALARLLGLDLLEKEEAGDGEPPRARP
jgi:hypothetical protein